jgi:hypothetical protein
MRTGSHIQALFKGKREAEFGFFSLGAGVPGVSMSAERAASQIIEACRRGEPFLTLGVIGRAAKFANALAPSTVTRMMALMNRLLPKKPSISAEEQRPEPGFLHHTALTLSPILAMGNRASQKYNEVG